MNPLHHLYQIPIEKINQTIYGLFKIDIKINDDEKKNISNIISFFKVKYLSITCMWCQTINHTILDSHITANIYNWIS